MNGKEIRYDNNFKSDLSDFNQYSLKHQIDLIKLMQAEFDKRPIDSKSLKLS